MNGWTAVALWLAGAACVVTCAGLWRARPWVCIVGAAASLVACGLALIGVWA